MNTVLNRYKRFRQLCQQKNVLQYLKHFLEENEQQQISRQAVGQCLKLSNYTPAQTKDSLDHNVWKLLPFMSFKHNHRYYKILEHLIELQYLGQILMFDSQLEENFFQVIQSCSYEIRCFFIANCNIGCNLSKYLKMISLKALFAIQILNDNFRNAALKQFTKLDIPNLTTLRIVNTYLTTDSLKFLSKNIQNYSEFGIFHHDKFQVITFGKLAYTFNRLTKEAISYRVRSIQRPYQMIYMQHLSKLRCDFGTLIHLEVHLGMQWGFFQQQIYFPQRTKLILKRVFILAHSRNVLH